MSKPIIQEIEDEVKTIAIPQKDKLKIKKGLKSLDKQVNSIIKEISSGEISDRTSAIIMCCIKVRNSIGTSEFNNIYEKMGQEIMKLDPKERNPFLMAYDVLGASQQKALEADVARSHELKLVALKSGVNPFAIDEMKVAHKLNLQKGIQNLALSGIATAGISYGVHKSTEAIDIISASLGNVGSLLANYEVCSQNTGSWLSTENLACSVGEMLYKPVRSSGAVIQGAVSSLSGLKFGSEILLGIFIFVGLLFFIALFRKMFSTKKLRIAFLGEIVWKFSSSSMTNEERKNIQKLLKSKKGKARGAKAKRKRQGR